MDHNKISHKGRGAVTIITGHFFLGDLRLGQVVDLPLGQVTVSLYKAALTCEIKQNLFQVCFRRDCFISVLFQRLLHVKQLVVNSSPYHLIWVLLQLDHEAL